MSIHQSVTFQEALEIIDSLPDHQQENLIDIIRHRLVEQKRNLIAQNIRKSRDEYARGEVTKGTIDELMKEISG
jgi:hypothetical protein